MRSRLLGGRYRLGPVIGVGGMGTVHRARDERLGAEVAVKVLRAGAAAADCERLRREVEFLSSVHHPNLVAMLDGGADGSGGPGADGVAWFVMELVAGPDLRTLLDERGPMDGSAVRRLLTGVLGALSAMHAAGLVHRDVTPSNILLTAHPFARWEAKLSDLGIARRVLSAPLTDAGRVVGTAAYLSPEQVVGGEVGPATDVYSLALVALEALTAVTPFPGSAVESATSRLLRAPTMPADLAPGWRDLLRAATSVDPGDRPPVDALRAMVADLPEDAGLRPGRRPEGVGRATPERAPRRSTAALPTAMRSTAPMRTARTAEMAAEPRGRRWSRGAVVLATSAAVIGGIAVVGSAAVVGMHVLTTASDATEAGTPHRSAAPTEQPTASTTAAPLVDGAQQDASAPADQAQTDGAAVAPDPAAGPPQQMDAGPGGGGPGAGPGNAAAPGADRPADGAGTANPPAG